MYIMNRPEGLELTGLHHVSAITANAIGNRDFYTRALGLRLVKKTVNQDAPDVYHLFYADGLGSAGTDVTFFDFPKGARNHPGQGEINEIALRVPGRAALDWWIARFDALGIEHDGLSTRAGFAAVAFRDPEGQRLALIDEGDSPAIPGGVPWDRATVPVEYGIRGLGAVTISSARPDSTLMVLTEILGFRVVEETTDPALPGNRDVLLETGPGGPGSYMIVQVRPNDPIAHQGRGGVHHVAFRVPTYEAHDAWNAYLQSTGLRVTPVIDRFYFKAMYFREPGGVLYEISSDEPGFVGDGETLETLGESLALPPFLEPQRAQIEASVVPLDSSPAVTTVEYGMEIPQGASR
jgi:glyoxalase family protein